MSKASDELERLSYAAWSDLATNVTRTGGNIGTLASAYARKNPVAVIGGGAMLAALVMSRRSNRASVVVERESHVPNASVFSSTIGGMLKMWLLETLTSSLTPHVEEEAPAD